MINNIPTIGEVYRLSSHMFKNADDELATVIDVKEINLDNEIISMGIRTPMIIAFMLCGGQVYPCTPEMLDY